VFVVVLFFRSAATWSNCVAPSSEASENVGKTSSPSKRRRAARLKKEDVYDVTIDNVKPTQVVHGTRLRVPGRPRRFPSHQRCLRLFRTVSNSTVRTASSFEIDVVKDEPTEKVNAEHGHMSENASGDEWNRWCVMNGCHNYYQTLNGDPSPERWPANRKIFNTHKRLNLVNHTITKSSVSESFADQLDKGVVYSPGDVVNGANLSCARDLFLSAVETDHAYAKRAVTPEMLYNMSKQHADDGSDNVLARLTALNVRSPHKTTVSCQQCTSSLQRIQKCTVTLNKLNDAVFEQRPKIKLQLHTLKRRSVEECSAVEDAEAQSCRSLAVSRAASADGCLPSACDSLSAHVSSVCDDMSTANVNKTSSSCWPSNFVQHSNFKFASGGVGQACEDWMPTSHSSGLDLLASVSSLTADRLQETSQPLENSHSNVPDWTQPVKTSPSGVPDWTKPVETSPGNVPDLTQPVKSSPINVPCWTEPVETSHSNVSDWTEPVNSCQQTSNFMTNAAKRHIKVFCVRKMCSEENLTSKQTALPTRVELMDVVRDYIAKGSSGPVCGTLPSRLTRQSPESYSQNGFTELS